MLLYYVRHGDPIYDPDSLTPLGERQAEAVAKRLAAHGIDRIFTSTSERAKLTAKPTAEMTRKTPVELDFANEAHAWRDLTCDLPDGKRTWLFSNPEMCRKLLSRDVLALGDRWYDHPDLIAENYGRGIHRIESECDAWLASLGYAHDRENRWYVPTAPTNERVALFAHQGFGIAFLSAVLDIPYPLVATHMDMSHSCVTVIEFTPHDGKVIPKMLMLSNDSHLWREGLPTVYARSFYV